MFDRERRLYADQYGYARQLTADIPDEEFAEEPVPGLNHPAWILGHLTVTADFGLHLLGEKPVAPDGWAALFAPGTVPDPQRATYPTKGEFLSAYEAGHAALAAAVCHCSRKSSNCSGGRNHACAAVGRHSGRTSTLRPRSLITANASSSARSSPRYAAIAPGDL